jgi:membrane protein
MKPYYFIKDFIIFSLEKNVGRHAKALTYSTVLALVPLLTIFLASFASSKWVSMAKEKIQGLLIENLFPSEISNTFLNYFNVIVQQASGIKTLGMIFFFVTIMFLFLDMEDSFADLAETDTKKKWYARVASIFSLFFVPLTIFVVFGAIEWFFSKSPVVIQDIFFSILGYSLVVKTGIITALWAWFYFLYRFLPHRRIPPKYLLVGSAFATLAFIASQQLFSWYLSVFSSYQVIYGVFSVIPVFLVWLYINWQITFYGFLIAFFCENYKKTITPKAEALDKLAEK